MSAGEKLKQVSMGMHELKFDAALSNAGVHRKKDCTQNPMWHKILGTDKLFDRPQH